jgi:tripartite-type tricarboxylate transporter receptor subunit TctC
MRAAVVAAVLALAGTAQAEDYPAKPIRLVVPFTPAGATDILARLAAQHLSQAWGQQVVVDNRPGAAGNIGTELVAKAPPDGYTILMSTVSTHGINPSLYAKIGYDAVKDFSPISLMALVPNVLEVNPSVKATNVKELVALAKASPGKINFASSGSGTSIHMSGELFKLMAGVDIVHVPYKGSAPALTDLLGGQVDMMFDNLGNTLQHIHDGRITAVAVGSTQRLKSIPDVPTLGEIFPGAVSTTWFGVVAPPKTPAAIAAKISADINEVLKMPDVVARFAGMSATPVGGTPEQTAAFIRAESERWKKVIAEAGVKVE